MMNRRLRLLPSILIATIIAGCAIGGFTVYVEFDRAHGIQSGDPVEYKGVTIGEVRALELEGDKVRVKLGIDSKYKNHLHSEATFVVTNIGGQRRLELIVLDENSPMVAKGHVFSGSDSRLEALARTVTKRLPAWWERFGSQEAGRAMDDAARFISRQLEELGNSDAVAQARRQAQEFLDSLDRLREEVDRGELRKHLEELRAEARQLARELEELGRTEQAERVRKRLESLLDHLADIPDKK